MGSSHISIKYLYSLHERAGTLDKTLKELCPCCLKQKCMEESHAEKFTLYCIEGFFSQIDKKEALV
ncbi:hypothetical protein [Papillibacter cinnamivorans]|uniref:hypothetical protein n=1 Tax=Papillibacter cinnamivorans TaxID=100176 RepID=UPI00117C6508|nr:hypothetical protein [Papillibacter cinnamivorans]